RLTVALPMPCCTEAGSASTSTFSPRASACLGVRPGPTPPFAAPAIAWFRCRVSPQNASSPKVLKRKVCWPWLISEFGDGCPGFWPAALPPGRALAPGALTTAVSVIATSAPAALDARAVAHLLCLCSVNADRHPGVLRRPVLVLERDEGAISSPSIANDNVFRSMLRRERGCQCPRRRVTSVLEQVTKHEVADGQVGGVERH